MFIVYILYSEKLGKYYVGFTSDLSDRMKRHNSGQGKFTKKGMPWRIVKTYEFESKSDAMRFEKKIKNKGVKRFVEFHQLDRAS